MTARDFFYFKSQRIALFEEKGINESKCRRARDRFSRFGEVGANGTKNEEQGQTIDEDDEE